MSLRININDVSETAFLTLYAHALDAQSNAPVLNDRTSISVAQLLDVELAKSNKKIHQKLVKGKVDKKMVTHIAIRSKKYDQYVRDFMLIHPKATIVNIGCGLDHRFKRIDNGEIQFIDLDLPDIINLKKELIPQAGRYSFVSQSVFDYSWMGEIKSKAVLFLAEGVFMYCNAGDVQNLFVELKDRFPGSEMVCEVFNSLWLSGWLKGLMKIKLQKELNLGKDAMFHFGIRDSKEMENWSEGIRFLDDWSYFDSDEKKLGWMKMFRHIKFFRKTQWTVHYRLGDV